ncbi:hypothetical protein F5144DRAFT_608511 [Chaetomium tenue]|uniref:Uncharacterized protein n=1 Tax=Chaetomium tenue TaxID=1854479 RepID=A0ACB7PNB7_9PEZI|nr:hypothetical protein F5144DRAFT_608511 [Chaetomium globosum]
MIPSKLTSAAWLMLLGTASAAPATEVETTAPAAAAALADTPTDTGAAQPVPTNELGASAFSPCSNSGGEFKPFCLPKHNDIFYPGATPYVTWDTTFFPDPNNTLVKVVGFYTNITVPSDDPADDTHNDFEDAEAFSSETISALWGFYQWHPEGSLLSRPSVDQANITLRLVALPANGQAAQWHSGPTVNLRWKPKAPKKKKPGHTPTRADDDVLYVALPLVFGFAALMIAGTFCWNRQLRRIGVGSVMGRRTGGTSSRRVGASKRDRARNRDKEQGIRLMESGGSGGMDSDEDGGWGEARQGAGRKRD